jgi:hypothetical protein
VRSDFAVTNAVWGENTMKAIPPRRNPYCWNTGAAVMSLGQTLSASAFGGLLSRPLYQSNGATLDVSTLSSPVAWPNLTAQEAMTSTDNQIIHMSDGSLVVAHITKTWAPMNPAPSWANTLVSYGGPSQVAGARNELLLEKSVDCGKTWQRFGTLDAGLVAGGAYGSPQTQKGTPPPWVGGWDRPELYADPFSSWLFASTDADHGTTSDGLILGASTGNSTSSPNASSWQVIATLPAGAPYVMTTTPNRRFYAFSCATGSPTLYYSTNPNDPTSLSSAVDLHYVNSYVPVCGRDPNTDLAINGTPNIAIARANSTSSPSAVQVMFEAVGYNGLQVIATATVTINDATPSNVTVTWGGLIYPADNQHSAVFATVIEPDYVDTPGYLNTNKTLPSVLYWLETTTTSNGNSDPAPNVCVRYEVLGSGIVNPGPYPLNRTNGSPACFPINKGTWLGDYMTGAFMWDKHRLSFIAQWPELTGTQASIIRLAPSGKVVSQPGLPGDVDGNGAADIIAAQSSYAAVALSNADSTFHVASAASTTVGGGWPIVTGDFNGDGLSDFLSTPQSGHYTSIALSNGNGTFTTVTSSSDLTPFTTQSGARLYAGDFDGDGLTDLAVVGVSWWNSIVVALNNGDGGHTFNILNKLNVPGNAFFAAVAGQSGAQVVVGDFDGDGRDDLAATGGTQPNGQPWGSIPVAFSNGDGTFRTTNSGSSFQTYSGVDVARVYSGDVDGDGRSDLIVLQVWPGGTGTIPIALSNGDGTFNIQNIANNSGNSFFATVASQPYAHVVVGDYNGDGLDDLAATGGEQYYLGPQWGTLPVALSNGDATFNSYNPSTSFQSYTQLNSAYVLSSWK